MYSFKQQNLVTVFLTALVLTLSVVSLPLDDITIPSSVENTNDEILEAAPSPKNKSQNLYVVKAVVYEIGILTESDENDTSDEDLTQERVDLTFFDSHRNNSHIDLGNIPLPVQTNISGQVLTGIAPINIGAFSSPSELLETLPLTGTIVNITHSDTAFFKLSTNNASQDDIQESLLKIPKPVEFDD